MIGGGGGRYFDVPRLPGASGRRKGADRCGQQLQSEAAAAHETIGRLRLRLASRPEPEPGPSPQQRIVERFQVQFAKGGASLGDPRCAAV